MKTVIVEARPSDATGQPVDIRLAGGGRSHYLFKDQSDWRAGVISLPRIQSALGFGKDGFTGGAVAQASAIGFSPAMASTRALIAGLIWNDAPITVSVADDEAADPSFVVRLAGTVAGYSVSAGRFVFTLSDMAGRLGEPLVKASFAGTGGIEGDAAAKGRVKRRSWGRCWNVEGRVLLAAWNIYEFGDPSRALSGFDAIKEKGRPVAMVLVAWAGSVAATLDALKTAVAPDGGCVIAPSIACVKFWTQPSTLTADLRGELGAGYVEHVPGIAAAISAAAEGPDLDGLAALAALRPDPAGLHADDASETPAQMLDRLTLRASLSWGVTADRRIALRPIAFADPVETVAFEDVERRAAYAPVAGVKIGWQKNHRVHTDAEISAAVLAGDVVYPDGKTVADLQPAQPGADVTGENTAKDTKAVGGRPVQKVIADLDKVNADLSGALTRFAGFDADLSKAVGDLEGVFKTMALLSPAVFDVAKLLSTSTAYLRARTTIDGMPIGTVVVETRDKTDSAVEDLRLLGARSPNGGAFNLDLSRVMVDGRTSLSQKLRQIEAKGEGDLNARATDLISTIVDRDQASAKRISLLEASAKGVTAKMGALEELVASTGKVTATRLDTIELALDTPVTGLKATVKDLVQATLTGEGSLLSRIGVMESSLNRADTGVWARIGTAEQLMLAQGKAFGQRLDTLDLMLDAPGTGLKTRFRDLEQATLTGNGSLAERISTMESSLNTPGTGVWGRIGAAEQLILAQDKAFAQKIDTVNAAIYTPDTGLSAQVALLRQATVNATGEVEAKAVLALDANGFVSGLVATNNGKFSKITFRFSESRFIRPDGTLLIRAGSAEAGEDPNAVYMPNVIVDTLKSKTIKSEHMTAGSASGTRFAIIAQDKSIPRDGTYYTVATVSFPKEEVGSAILVRTSLNVSSPDDLQFKLAMTVSLNGGGDYIVPSDTNLVFDNFNSNARMAVSPFAAFIDPAVLAHTGYLAINITIRNVEVDNIPLTIAAGSVIEFVEVKAAMLAA